MIHLRDLRPEDKEIVRNWRNSPEVSKYMHTDQYITVEAHEQWFHRTFGDDTRKYWIVTYDGQDVGLVNLYDIDHVNQRCYWAFYIAAPNMRGKGIGTFVEYEILRIVFEELKLNKLCGEIISWNERIIHIHYSFGYKKEGYLRQHIIKGGEPMDVVVIGMLREEWELNKPELEERLRKKGLL
ncbi:MAG: UDP-4-amino-4,6-dideoxy-N-acetyl-beta-L-altrosamine N-acetyltransferase [Anaerolineales bacterium]|nr:UDP-4-amino-4,6-dideoxy-N-acetyl-beta-L-altrosamine N-acetyltransferase [Anaerolineales bacterium]